MYLGTMDPDLHPVVISYPKLLLALDLRDQQVHPHGGGYVSSELQVAGVGGSAVDFKTVNEIRGYLPLSRKWTLAARVNVGLLFAKNYGSTIEATSNGANYEDDPAIRPGWVRDIQLMFLRGFFAGGAGSNRGYALREIGPHGIVPQATSTLANTNCTESPDNPDCNLPLGGFTLWEASLELRFPISGAFSGAFFTDTADVSTKNSQLPPQSAALERRHRLSLRHTRWPDPLGCRVSHPRPAGAGRSIRGGHPEHDLRYPDGALVRHRRGILMDARVKLPSRVRRYAKRAGVAVGVLLALVVLLVVAVFFSLRFAVVRSFVVARVNGALDGTFKGRLVLHGVGNVGLSGIAAADAEVFDPAGRRVLDIHGLERTAQRAHPRLGGPDRKVETADDSASRERQYATSRSC